MNDIFETPLIFAADLASVPPELRKRPQWVAWQYEPDSKHPDKPKKVPLNLQTGKKASTTDPRTWGTYEQAHKYAETMLGNVGIGYVFSPDDPYAGVDFDHCRSDSGEITLEVKSASRC
jgi:putative DNA primase/helicase